MELPKDNMMLLSLVNTKLRDFYPSLGNLCRAENVSEQEIRERLEQIDYRYDSGANRFV